MAWTPYVSACMKLPAVVNEWEDTLGRKDVSCISEALIFYGRTAQGLVEDSFI